MSHTGAIVSGWHGALAKPLGFEGLSGGSGIAFGHSTSPFVSAYPWVDGSGFGTKYANPATLPAAAVSGANFSPNGDTLFLAFSTTPFISAYPWNATTGFGTKYANPATLPAAACVGLAVRSLAAETVYSIATCDNDSGGGGPFIGAWRFNKSGGWGTKYTNPAVTPPNVGGDVAFTPDGSALACAHTGSPFITSWPFTASGFGTKFTNPATLAGASGTGCAFSTPGTALVLSHNFNASSVSVSAWPWSASGYGTKYTDASALGGGGSPAGLCVAMRYQNDALVVGTGFNGVIGAGTAYRWNESSGFGTQYSQISPLITGAGNYFAWNRKGTTIFSALTPSPFMFAKTWGASGFDGTYTNPATPLPDVGRRVAVRL